MAGEKMVWGIDIGQCALKALKLQLVGEEIEAEAFDIVEHAKPLNPNERGGEALTEALQQAIEALMSRNDMLGDSVVIGVPGYQAFTRFTKLPPVEKKQLPAIVQFEAGQQIPYEIDQVIWDYQIFSDEDSPDVEVGIFCMRNEQLDRYLTPFIEAGLQPILVQPAPLALYNFIQYDAAEPGKATVLLDIGAESTDLIVSDRGSVWTRAVPIGGNNFTERLVDAFRLDFSKAESLKRQAATSKYARQIFQAMRPVYQDLVSEIQRSVGRYTQTHRDAKLDRVIGMGNGFRLPGLQKFLQQNLQMKVERLSAFNNLLTGPTLNAPTLNEQVLSLGVAYGLAVQGLGRGHIESNLLPPQIAKRAIWRRKRPIFGAVAACMVLASVAIWARYLLDSSALARNAPQEEVSVPSMNERAIQSFLRQEPGDMKPREYVAKALGAATSLASDWRNLHQEVEQAQAEVEPVMDLIEDQPLWSRVLRVIHQAMPTPPEPLAKAASLKAYLAAVKQIPRGDRRQIFVETMDTTYVPNVEEELAPLMGEEEEPGRGRGRGRAPARGRAARGRGGRGGTPSREGSGFIVKIQGWTPYAEATIIEDYMNALRKLGNPTDPNRAEDLGFYVVMPPQERPRLRNPTAVVEGPPKRPVEAEEGKAPELGADFDPITGEWAARDWLFRLTFGVALGASPEASAEPEDARGGRRR